MKSVCSVIRSFRLLALLAVALGVSQAQTVSTSGCLPVPTDDDNPCAVSYSITITTNGASIDTYALAGGDDIDASFDVEIDLSVSGPGVADAASDDQEVDLEDNLPPNAAGIYSATANIEACEGYTGEAVRVNEEGGGGCYGGSYSVRMLATIPSVASVSPNSITIGSSGTLTLTGNNFIDTFGDSPTPVSNSGVTLNLTSVSSSQATVSYSANSTAAGQFTIGLIGLFGEGTQQALTVVDPTPTVSSVSPSSWNSGTTTTITIYGSGFGTNPSLSITGPGVTGYSLISASNTQIVATVTVAPLVAPQTATVQVQSNGYSSSGFLGNPGQPASASNTAGISPVSLVPQISGQPAPPVFAGQKITLSVSAPAGLTLSAPGWSGSAADPSVAFASAAIGGWVPGSQPIGLTTDSNAFTFYFTSGGGFNVQVGCTLTDSAGVSANCASSSVTLNVTTPTNVNVVTNFATTQMQVLRADTDGLTITPDPAGGTPLMVLSNNGVGGVTFTPTAAAPSGNAGAYSWVQLISNYTIRTVTNLSSTGTATCTPQLMVGQGPVLDRQYPYPAGANSVAQDSPGIFLPAYTSDSNEGEAKLSFGATMYLMWTPPAPTGCSTAACTVPVPLGSVSWSVSGDAINSLTNQTNGTTWIFNAPQCSNKALPVNGTNSFNESSIYPTWKVTLPSFVPLNYTCVKP